MREAICHLPQSAVGCREQQEESRNQKQGEIIDPDPDLFEIEH